MLFFLKILRKIFKSLGKKEEKIKNLIIHEKFKKISHKYKIDLKKFNQISDLEKNTRLVVTIAYFFNKKKLVNLNKVCLSLFEISKFTKIYILTNNISSKDYNELKKAIKVRVKIVIIKSKLSNRILPWYHLEYMKKAFNEKKITHFIYLEDDILLNKQNFTYWLKSRNYLKKLNLIPGFVRVEKYKNDKDFYAVDYLKRTKLNSLGYVKTNREIKFVNNPYPYQGMYLYDRELMKEHLTGPSSNPDCGHGAYNLNFINQNMINHDLVAKANMGLTFINVPEGFINRIVIPFNFKENQIDKDCCIRHLSNKYVNKKSWFGNIKVKEALIKS